jgi:predicted PurR-regulated permease PerM
MPMDETMRNDSYPDLATDVTPIPISPRVRTVLLLVALAALVLLFQWSPSLLPLLLGGATLALILSFPVRLLARALPRGVAIALVVAALLLLLALALVTLVPLLIRQLTELIVATPGYATDAEGWLRRALQPLAERGLLPAEPGEVIDNIRRGLLDRAQTLAQRLLGSVFGVLTGTVGTLLQLVGVLFIAIYLLADIRRFEAAYLRAAPHRYRRDARELWGELGQSLSRYLGGLLVSLAIQGVLAFMLMSFLGVPYAFLLGLWTAATGVLPYIGAFLGAIPAVVLALFISPWTAVLTALGFVAIQQLEGNILTPRIQGEAVKAHPLLVLLAVLRVLFDFFTARLQVRPTRDVAIIAPAEATLPEATPPVVSACPAAETV